MLKYTELKRQQIGDVELVIEYAPSNVDPRRAGITKTGEDIEEIVKKIDSGVYSWFSVYVKVLFNGYEVTSKSLGCRLYENPLDCIPDIGYLIDKAIEDANFVIDQWKTDLNLLSCSEKYT